MCKFYVSCAKHAQPEVTKMREASLIQSTFGKTEQFARIKCEELGTLARKSGSCQLDE